MNSTLLPELDLERIGHHLKVFRPGRYGGDAMTMLVYAEEFAIYARRLLTVVQLPTTREITHRTPEPNLAFGSATGSAVDSRVSRKSER